MCDTRIVYNSTCVMRILSMCDTRIEYNTCVMRVLYIKYVCDAHIVLYIHCVYHACVQL